MEDTQEAIKVYKSKADYKPILYPIPINIELLNSIGDIRSNGITNILIGNSADPSNNHLEIIQYLSKFREEDIQIYCPLSYYSDKNYIESVIKAGNNIFGIKFIPLTNLLPSNEYANLLSKMQIALMNHNRQQALGNILPLMHLGTKVYLKPEISTYRFLKRWGCKVFDINSLDKLSFKEFANIASSDKKINKNKVEELTSEEYCSSLWNSLLKSH